MKIKVKGLTPFHVKNYAGRTVVTMVDSGFLPALSLLLSGDL
jgi:hypothetical protein